MIVIYYDKKSDKQESFNCERMVFGGTFVKLVSSSNIVKHIKTVKHIEVTCIYEVQA